MQALRLIFANRMCVMFCIALTLVFAGASLSGVMNTIQHAPGASPDHDHMVFGAASIEQDHAEHHAPQPDRDSPADHLPGSHHHHGDSGSGMPVASFAGATMPAMPDNAHPIAPDTPKLGLSTAGPERPPKRIANQA